MLYKNNVILCDDCVLKNVGTIDTFNVQYYTLQTSFENGYATNDLARFMINGKPLGTSEFAEKLVAFIQSN